MGYPVISKVSSLLHTPLMSATNVISGISLVGSIVPAGSQHDHELEGVNPEMLDCIFSNKI